MFLCLILPLSTPSSWFVLNPDSRFPISDLKSQIQIPDSHSSSWTWSSPQSHVEFKVSCLHLPSSISHFTTYISSNYIHTLKSWFHGLMLTVSIVLRSAFRCRFHFFHHSFSFLRCFIFYCPVFHRSFDSGMIFSPPLANIFGIRRVTVRSAAPFYGLPKYPSRNRSEESRRVTKNKKRKTKDNTHVPCTTHHAPHSTFHVLMYSCHVLTHSRIHVTDQRRARAPA